MRKYCGRERSSLCRGTASAYRAPAGRRGYLRGQRIQFQPSAEGARTKRTPRPRQGAKAATATHDTHRYRPTSGLVLGYDLSACTGVGALVSSLLYSRKIVGWEVHDSDHADHAAHLVRRSALAEGIAALATRPCCMATTARRSRRRRVSDDNAYPESLFRTAKYRPEFPAKGFADLDDARACAVGFVRWYNIDHRHSGIRYVSPAQRHAGEDLAILAARHALYAAARELNPARWSGNTRNWSPIETVTLNPERDCVVKSHSAGTTIQPLAA